MCGILGGVDDDLRITRRLLLPSSELVERFSRASGPGGQSVNTTDSRVELSFDVARSPSLTGTLRERALEHLDHRLSGGVLTVAASRERSQLANRRAARQRLAQLLSEAVAPPPPPRRETKPGRAAKRRRLDAKKHRSRVKQQRRRGDPGDA